MACFLGCFGYSSKRKHRKPANKVLPGDHRLISYEPLDFDSHVSTEPSKSNSKLSRKPKKGSGSSIKIRKKVSFNLNVQAYEPLPPAETTTDEFLESSNKEEGWKNQGKEDDKGSTSHLSEENSNFLQRSVSYPNNHRYKNCIDRYDEEDLWAYEESDIDDDEEDIGEEFLDPFESLPEEFSREISSSVVAPCDSSDGEKKTVGSGNARIRSQYVSSVLNPVENISQWKAVKAKATKYLMKENIALEKETRISSSTKPSSEYTPFNPAPNSYNSKPLLQDVAVDVSLSKWIASS